ncbi:MAG: galactokinase [Culturomica sp.]|jgi:galactokinase|nr:galactokinase [Culturomica sp.]
MDTARVRETFREKFGTEGMLYFSPGRINLIGEHTDYNGGCVLPGAIDKGILAEIKPNGSDKVRAYALDLDDYAEFGLNEADKPAASWACYIFGVCREMQKRGAKLEGFDTVFSGDVPLGAGLSSSAALESAFGFALNEIFRLGFDKKELVLIGQKTEHNYCGVNCGIMDQFASLFGKEGHLIRLDCSTMEYEYVPFDPKGYRVVLVDSVTKHELVGSPYNKRRQSCENAATAIAAKHPEVKFLADADMEMLEEVKDAISEEDYKRAAYAIQENERLVNTCDALKKGDYATVGKNMYATHRGMSKLYEVSTEELDFLNDVAEACGVTGSRIMGGGFGGCTINVVPEDKYDAFIATAVAKFKAKYGKEPKIYPVKISDGARRLT